MVMRVFADMVNAAILAVCAAILASSVFGAEITGKESVHIGQLATFSADVEGDWLVVPAKGVGVAKDTGKKALYLSATVEGEYTIIFFAVENGAPVITQKALTVGTPEPTPEPQPNPAPVVTLTNAEREAVSSVMSSILRGIEAGTIRTPQGARATFKKLLTEKIAACEDGTCALSENMIDAIRTWEASMDITTLEGIRIGFKKVLEGLK